MAGVRVVLVTGCGSGLGLATARELVRRGHVVYAGLRDASTAPDLHGAVPVQLDVTVAAEREATVARILDEHGRIDAVVNNAGVGVGAFLEELDEDELREVFDVNVFAVFALTQGVLPAMRAQGGGVVVNVSSLSGRLALPGLGSYAASKFALEGMSEAWRHELSLMGIDLYVVEPGAYDTDIWTRNRRMGRRALDPASPWLPFARAMDDRFSAIVERSKRDPAEVGVCIADLVDGRRRGFRHPIGPMTRPRLIAAKILPFGVIQWLTRRVFFR